MNIFDYNNGVLHAESVSTVDIAAQYGTPCYVYSRKAFEEHYLAYENALQGEEEHYGKQAACGQRDEPGQQDPVHDPQVERPDSPGHPDPEDRAHQRVGRGNGQTRAGCDDHGRGGRQFCSESA